MRIEASEGVLHFWQQARLDVWRPLNEDQVSGRDCARHGHKAALADEAVKVKERDARANRHLHSLVDHLHTCFRTLVCLPVRGLGVLGPV